MEFPGSIFDYPVSPEQWVDFAKLFIDFGIQLFMDFQPQEQDSYENGKIEFCTSSTLHRGYYHPSPVYDLIVGNTKRGKLTRKLPTTNSIVYRYIFDQNGVMRCVDRPHKNAATCPEYLLYMENKRYGITFDYFGHLAAITEEVFANNQLINFTLANYGFVNNNYQCFDFRTESYQYDNKGLALCAYRKLSPQSGMRIIDDIIHFERTNGYLTSYTLFHVDQPQQPSKTYPVTKKRKVQMPFVIFPSSV